MPAKRSVLFDQILISLINEIKWDLLKISIISMNWIYNHKKYHTNLYTECFVINYKKLKSPVYDQSKNNKIMIYHSNYQYVTACLFNTAEISNVISNI